MEAREQVSKSGVCPVRGAHSGERKTKGGEKTR